MKKFVVYNTEGKNKGTIVRIVEAESKPPTVPEFDVLEVCIDFKDPENYIVLDGELIMKEKLNIGYEDNEVIHLGENGIEFILPDNMDIFIDDKWILNTKEVEIKSEDSAEYKLTFKNNKYLDKTIFLRFTL